MSSDVGPAEQGKSDSRTLDDSIESLKYIVRERLDAGGRQAFVEACNEAEAKFEA